MDNLDNSFNDNFDENPNLAPSRTRGKSCGGQILSLLSLLVAILTLLFGENILGRRNLEEMPSPEVNNATAIIDSLSDSPGDYVKVIPDLAWKSSINESEIYDTRTITDEQLSDFDLEVTLKFEDEQNEFHGVIFRKIDENQYYSFQITPLGDYAIYRHEENSAPLSLTGPLHSNSILIGQGQLNKLRVKAIGPVFDFFINDTLITQLTESTLPTGGIGLYTCTCNGSEGSSVSFYDLTISSLP